ncbi:hypothetical protein OK016_16885 [Vibrio chagasii]|nr:hypothetical protein [Vibrio chagasii]
MAKNQRPYCLASGCRSTTADTVQAQVAIVLVTSTKEGRATTDIHNQYDSPPTSAVIVAVVDQL